MAVHKENSQEIPHSEKLDTDQLCCPHRGTKLRRALVSADLVSLNSASSLEGPRIVPNGPSETIEAAPESSGDALLLEAVEKRTILTAVQKAGNDKMLAARMLGIGRTTLYRRLQEYRSEALSTLISADSASSRHAPKIIQKAPTETIEEMGTVGESVSHPDPLEAIEKTAILRAMQETENDRQLVAQMLGIGRTTLYRKLKEYGISRSRRPRSKVARNA